jgi:hypothetical protein
MADNNEAFNRAIISAFDAVIKRDLESEAAVREEIKQRGNRWAASEIFRLRRHVAALCEQRDKAAK